MARLGESVFADSEIRALRFRLSYLLKEPADVDDVIQDACLRVLEYSAESRAIENPAAFLHRIARNLAIDHLRWRERTARICSAADDSEEATVEMHKVSAQQRQADEALEDDECLNAILMAVSQLPPKCRQAFMMSQFEERTYREISQKVGLSVSMIEKYVLRARRHIASRVAPLYAVAS
jgi:RNA polymerase sigma-70 factor (ECF subfamily)